MTTVHVISRSLDARPLGRLLWKEYRQQRSLWLVALAMGMVVQLVLRLALPSGREVVEVVFGVSLFLSVFYLIGSSAMLFALEREDRTSDWLVSLAAPPGWTLLAKYGFAIISTVALCTVMLFSALVLTVGHPLPLDGFAPPQYEYAPLQFSAGFQLVVAALTFGIVILGFLAWGALGSLTSRRVIEAVPVALVWWIMIVCVPMAVVAFLVGGQLNSAPYDRAMPFGLGAALLGVIAADMWLGWKWCRGSYVDATILDDLNERLSSRLKWRKARAARIPARVEYEFSGWRTWQRLVWQERHRESLHTGLLAIVCGVGVLLTLFSLTQRESITFAIIGLIVLLPVAMGVLGFRFDAAGQQLRFLANRGSSPLAIWLAKQVVWLPRVFWIPAVAWGVTCLAEWLIVPRAPGELTSAPLTWNDTNHHVLFVTSQMLPYWNAVLWFVLLSYAAGQLMAILLRQFVIAAAASLVLSGLLSGWLALMVHFDVPRWWSVGSLVVWMLMVTAWYSRHWLLERRTWAVFGRLSIGLLVPPLLLLGTVATYRWLEVPGCVLKSRWLFALLYPQEAARRADFGGADGGLGETLKAEIERLERPVPPDEKEALQKLRLLCAGLSTVEEFRQIVDLNRVAGLVTPAAPEPGSPVGDDVMTEADLPADALDATQDQRARAAFWAANESRLKEIVEVVRRDHCQGVDRYLPRENSGVLALPQRLLVEAGRLRTDEGRFDEALDYYCASLRLAKFWAESDSPMLDWSVGNRQQSEILASVVEWSNHKAAANESLLTAISRVRDELARFPTMRETVLRESVTTARLLPVWLTEPDFKSHFPAAYLASFLPTEFVRAQRVGDQQLFWQWHHIRSFEAFLQQPGVNAPQMFEWMFLQDDGLRRDEQQRTKTPLAWMAHPTPDKSTMEMVVNREATIRLTLLAMAMLEWKRVHHEMPDYLGNLAPYCVIEKHETEGRVLPVMVLNDPWTGELFEYPGFWFRSIESRTDASHVDAPTPLLYSAGPNPKGYAAGPVLANHPHVIETIGGSMGISIQSRKGWLSLVIPLKPKR